MTERSAADEVVYQTGCTREQADEAVAKHPGDLVGAIMYAADQPRFRAPTLSACPGFGASLLSAVPPEWQEAGREAHGMIEGINSVRQQTGCTRYAAVDALDCTRGSIADAIRYLERRDKNQLLMPQNTLYGRMRIQMQRLDDVDCMIGTL